MFIRTAMTRGYQFDCSRTHSDAMYDASRRQSKARTMVAVLADHFKGGVDHLQTLDVGASTGIR